MDLKSLSLAVFRFQHEDISKGIPRLSGCRSGGSSCGSCPETGETRLDLLKRNTRRCSGSIIEPVTASGLMGSFSSYESCGYCPTRIIMHVVPGFNPRRVLGA